MPLIKQLLPLLFDDLGFNNFFLDFLKKFLLFILLNLHDSLYIFLFIRSFDDFVVLFLLHFLLSHSLYLDEILLFALQFFDHLLFILHHLDLIILSDFFSLLLLYLLLSFLLLGLYSLFLFKLSFSLISLLFLLVILLLFTLFKLDV